MPKKIIGSRNNKSKGKYSTKKKVIANNRQKNVKIGGSILEQLLDEADKVSIGDLEFNRILDEERTILSDIQSLLNKEAQLTGNRKKLCKLVNARTLKQNNQPLLHKLLIIRKRSRKNN